MTIPSSTEKERRRQFFKKLEHQYNFVSDKYNFTLDAAAMAGAFNICDTIDNEILITLRDNSI